MPFSKKFLQSLVLYSSLLAALGRGLSAVLFASTADFACLLDEEGAGEGEGEDRRFAKAYER